MKKLSSILFAAILLLACEPQKSPKYIFYFIGDGMGVNQVLGTQMYLAEQRGVIGVDSLSFTSFPYRAHVSTYSQYNAVTCSAASGTALATGVKTRKGAIGVDSLLQHPLKSVAYYAQEQGMRVGVATSVSIDHATPAAFYAHQPDRHMSYEIGIDLAKSGFDFFAGSGFASSQKDREQLLPLLRDSGYQLVHGVDSVAMLSHNERIVLIQHDYMLSLPYAIDRGEDDMTLRQITEAAITHLYQPSSKGFFAMIEGGLIDWACHSNDAATVFEEVRDFSDAIAVACEFYKQHPDETLIVVTADHETGGLSLGNGPYELHLSRLSAQQTSLYQLSPAMKRGLEQGTLRSWDDFKLFLAEHVGLGGAVPMTTEEEDYLRSIYEKTVARGENSTISNLYAENSQLLVEAVAMLNKKAHVAWSSGGHSAGAVPVYAIGCGSEHFAHVRDNVDIARCLKDLIVQ